MRKRFKPIQTILEELRRQKRKQTKRSSVTFSTQYENYAIEMPKVETVEEDNKCNCDGG